MTDGEMNEILTDLLIHLWFGILAVIFFAILLILFIYPVFMYFTFDNLPKDSSKKRDRFDLQSPRAMILLADREVGRAMVRHATQNRDTRVIKQENIPIKDWQKERIKNYEKGLCYLSGKPTFKKWAYDHNMNFIFKYIPPFIFLR